MYYNVCMDFICTFVSKLVFDSLLSPVFSPCLWAFLWVLNVLPQSKDMCCLLIAMSKLSIECESVHFYGI